MNHDRQVAVSDFFNSLLGLAQSKVFRNLITDFTTLLVTINPISVVPVFLGLTGGKSPGEQRRIAVRACLIATAILLFMSLPWDERSVRSTRFQRNITLGRG